MAILWNDRSYSTVKWTLSIGSVASSQTTPGANLTLRSPWMAGVPALQYLTSDNLYRPSSHRIDGSELSAQMHTATAGRLSRTIPLWLIVLFALAFHGPLLMLHVPANSFDANFHMSMASHYAQHWFNPWNEKAFAGFSQTTYPPLTHQWTAMFSYLMGLTNAFMLVQGIVILLLPVGVYRFAQLWTSDRAASYAAFFSIFLGSLCLLVY